MFLLNAFRGLCMALADSVPGVSGGTIAFLLGFYDKFINALHSLTSRKSTDKKESVIFLLKMGLGWAIGFLGAMLVLSELFESHIYVVSSLFFGLTLFAIPVVIHEERDSMKGHLACLPFTLLGIVIVVGVSMLNQLIGGGGISFTDGVHIGSLIYTFIAGMLAISAMVLPGISGSTILLAFGVYLPTVDAISAFLKERDFTALPYVIALGLGIVAGVIAIIRSVKIALEKFRPQSVYTIVGLMIGSLYAIMQGPTTLDTPLDALSFSNFCWIPFLLGGVILATLELIRYVLEKKNIQ